MHTENKPQFENILKHTIDVVFLKTGKRISRGERILGSTLLATFFGLLQLLLTNIGFNLQDGLLLFVIIHIIWQLAIVINRLHDLGKKDRKVVYILIPLVNIYRSFILLFKEGTKGENEYGSDPLEHQPQSNDGYRILFVVLFIAELIISLNLPKHYL